MFSELGPALWVHLLLIVGGVLWSGVCALLLGLKWKVPAVVATAPLFAHAFTIFVAASYAGSTVNAALSAAPEERAMYVAFGVSQVLSNAMFAPMALLSAGLVGTGALVGGLRGPKRWGAPVLAILIYGLVGLLPMFNLLSYGSVGATLLRSGLYLACAIPAGLAIAGAHPHHSGREAGVTAAMCFVTLVGACETAALAHEWSQGFAALAGASPESKAALVTAMAAEIAPHQTVAWLALALSSVPAFIALFRAPMSLTDEEIMNSSVNPSGMRWLGSALAVGLLVLWAMVFLVTNPADILILIAKM